MNPLERYAAQRVLDKALEAGVEAPAHLVALCRGDFGAAASAYLAAHPDFDDSELYCCYGAIMGLGSCTCWEPIFDSDQAEPRPPALMGNLLVQPKMCADCAYRPGSPEREHEFEEEALLELPSRGEMFFCHQGMRRPVLYRHPILGDVPADPADYQPPRVKAIPFQADGSPGLLCAGWASHLGKGVRR